MSCSLMFIEGSDKDQKNLQSLQRMFLSFPTLFAGPDRRASFLYIPQFQQARPTPEWSDIRAM